MKYFFKASHNLLVFILFFIGYLHSINADVPANVQTVFINNGCLNCHGAVNPNGGLSLVDAATSETQLVDVNANCNMNVKRVLAGDPTNSALYRKISMQNPGCGGVMPPGGNLISQSDQKIIFDWIVAIGPASQFGLIEMQATSVTVQENTPSVTLTVERQLGTQGIVSVDYVVSTLATDTATDVEDYVASSGTISFADGVASATVNVALVDDMVFEDIEVFSVTLSNVVGGAVLGSQIQAKVNIQDNEVSTEPGTFLFSAVNYSGNESDGTIDITILRSFGAAGNVSIDLNSSDISAISNSDYTMINQTLVFEEGVKSSVIQLVLLNDEIAENRETLTLTLSNPANGAQLGSSRSVTVTIIDDDSPVVDSGNGGNDDNTTEEASYTAAGAVMYLLPLCFLLFVFQRKKL